MNIHKELDTRGLNCPLPILKAKKSLGELTSGQLLRVVGWLLYGKEKPAFIIAKPGNGDAASSNGGTIGFAAASTADVDAFHAAGLANGGSDEGAPGPRSHLPGAYAAYLRDPAGNKICSYTFTE